MRDSLIKKSDLNNLSNYELFSINIGNLFIHRTESKIPSYPILTSISLFRTPPNFLESKFQKFIQHNGSYVATLLNLEFLNYAINNREHLFKCSYKGNCLFEKLNYQTNFKLIGIQAEIIVNNKSNIISYPGSIFDTEISDNAICHQLKSM